MRTLLRKRESSPDEHAAPPEREAAPTANGSAPEPEPAATTGAPEPADAVTPAPPQTCRACGAAMTDDQDWCLECGAAAPGRLGQRPGWRLGAVVLALTLLLVGGASVAGYAAVTSDAERETAAQNPAPGTPVPAPVATPPAPERPTSEPPEPEPVEPVEPAPTPSAQPDFTVPDATPVDPPTTIDPVTPLPDTSGTDTGTGTTGGTVSEPEAYTIPADEFEVYDPYDRAGAEFGDPADARNTDEPFFDVTVPADGEPIGAGLQVDLGAIRDVRQVTFRTTTPGMGIELYGVRTGKPNGLRAGWRLLEQTTLPSGERDVTISFDGDPKRIRRLVLWFTTPANPEDPRASVGQLKVS